MLLEDALGEFAMASLVIDAENRGYCISGLDSGEVLFVFMQEGSW